MALVIYPTTDYDSFISVVDATSYISKYSLHLAQWSALDEATKEIYLRIATNRILDVVDETLLVEDECLKGSCALMAVRDLVYTISSGVNENKGLITKEKVGDVEVTYYQGQSAKVNGLNKNPYPADVQKCLVKYGAEFNAGFRTATIVRA